MHSFLTPGPAAAIPFSARLDAERQGLVSKGLGLPALKESEEAYELSEASPRLPEVAPVPYPPSPYRNELTVAWTADFYPPEIGSVGGSPTDSFEFL